MTPEKIPRNALLGLVLYAHLLNAASPADFTGLWERVESRSASERLDAVLNIALRQSHDGNISGSYCFVTRNGQKIDCGDNESENIQGHTVKETPGRAIVKFRSFFGARNGKAEIQLIDTDSIEWTVITQPKGGDYYGPTQTLFKLVSTELNTRGNSKQIVSVKAYLYDKPAFESARRAYLIKGDFVRPLNISIDLKFWYIEFAKPDGSLIRKWLDCRDIDFCPN